MKTINLISIEGKSVGEKSIPENVGVLRKVNRQTVFEVVNAEHQNSRQGTHDTKNKAEVSGTGKKPYRQKHTGRARQGSRRNPHFTGGGVAFGPTPDKNYKVKVNRKVFKIGILSVWSKILESGNLAVLDGSFGNIDYSTKTFSRFLKDMNINDKKILFICSEQEKKLSASSRNISGVTNKTAENVSVRDLLDQNFLLISEGSFEKFMDRLAPWK